MPNDLHNPMAAAIVAFLVSYFTYIALYISPPPRWEAALLGAGVSTIGMAISVALIITEWTRRRRPTRS